MMTPFSLFAKRQTETIVSTVSFIEMVDSIALIEPVLDSNNDACALIQVFCTPNVDIQYVGNIFKKEQRENSVWLWMVAGSKNLTISAPNMLPKTISFAEAGYPSLHECTTYKLDIALDKESEDIRYRDVDVVKEKYHTSNVYHNIYEEIKTKYFVSYQYQYGFPLGISLGFCKKYGAYVFLNYVDTSLGFAGTYQQYDDQDMVLWSIGGGLMCRLAQKWFLQIGGGITMADNEETFFTGGALLILKTKISIGLGFYYNGASCHFDRNVLLDGLCLQLGF